MPTDFVDTVKYITGVVSLVLILLIAWGTHRESKQIATLRVVRYSKVAKIFVALMWIAILWFVVHMFSDYPDSDFTFKVVFSAILYAVAGAGLHLASFGLDPLKSKGMEGIDTYQQDRVARVGDEAEKPM